MICRARGTASEPNRRHRASALPSSLAFLPIHRRQPPGHGSSVITGVEHDRDAVSRRTGRSLRQQWHRPEKTRQHCHGQDALKHQFIVHPAIVTRLGAGQTFEPREGSRRSLGTERAVSPSQSGHRFDSSAVGPNYRATTDRSRSWLGLADEAVEKRAKA